MSSIMDPNNSPIAKQNIGFKSQKGKERSVLSSKKVEVGLTMNEKVAD